YYGLDLSGTIPHTKMIFMNLVLMAGFSEEVQVCQVGHGSRQTIQKNILPALKDLPASTSIFMISLHWIYSTIRIIVLAINSHYHFAPIISPALIMSVMHGQIQLK